MICSLEISVGTIYFKAFVSQGTVETLFRWSGKHYNCMFEVSSGMWIWL